MEVIAAVRIPSSPAEHAAIWAIRIALLLMVFVLGSELRGAKNMVRTNAFSWLAGALFALAHSIGSIVAFHAGSQAEAIEATAQQTQELLGFRFGIGLFANYAFVLVWLADALLRVLRPVFYHSQPRAYAYAVRGFLIFIAINGAIVFQASWTRWVGLICIGVLALMAWQNAVRRTATTGRA